MKNIQIVLTDDNGTNAPLWVQYPLQYLPQPAYLEFIPDEECSTIDLVAEYSSSCSNSIPYDEYDLKLFRFSVPSNITRHSLEQLQESAHLREMLNKFEEVALAFDRFYDSSEEIRGLSNEISEYIKYHCEIASIYSSEEWLEYSITTEENEEGAVIKYIVDDFTITSDTQDYQIKEYANKLESQQCLDYNQVVIGDYYNMLVELRAEL